MISPLLLTVCDKEFNKQFGTAFANSARANGNEVNIIETPLAKIFGPEMKGTPVGGYGCGRFVVLLEMLKHHPAILVLDIDSIVRAKIEIEPEYDLGICLRPDHESRVMNRRVQCSAFYATDRAIPFVQAICKRFVGELISLLDQTIVYEIYQQMKDDFKIKILGTDFIDWNMSDTAKIWTAKGPRKYHDERYLSELKRYGT